MKERKLTKVVGENFKIAKENYYMNNKGEKVSLENTIIDMINNTEDIIDVIVDESVDYQNKYTVRENIVNMGTIDCILKLREEGVKGNIISLIFANAVTPGGGYLSGSKAQEESICRSSMLFETLQKQKDFYIYNKEKYTPLHTDRMMYIHNVPIIRDDNLEYLDNYKTASFISSPAVNRRIALGKVCTDEDVDYVMNKRIEKILTLAVSKNPEVIVLGAYGCGVFGCDREKVFDIFEKHIRRIVPNNIKIIFAVKNCLQN